MIELEKTYLAKALPDLTSCPSKEMIDLYIPDGARHPVLRLRKNGSRYELTRKYPEKDDPSKQVEETIHLTKEEYETFLVVSGRRVEKTRYEYVHQGRKAEIDVFGGALKGLVLIDFEFTTEAEKDAFEKPAFCLADVTHEEAIAGGLLAGKTLEDLQAFIETYGYTCL